LKFKDYLDLIVKFTGDQKKFPDFKFQVETAASGLKDQGEFLKIIIIYKLSEDVRSRVLDLEIKTVEELLHILDNTYGGTRSEFTLKQELGKIRQGRDSVVGYTEKMDSLVRELRRSSVRGVPTDIKKGKLASVEMDAVAAYINGLSSPSLRLKLEIKCPTSYDDAKNFAANQIEANQAPQVYVKPYQAPHTSGKSSQILNNYAKANQEKHTRCFKCNREGHFARDCRVKIEGGQTPPRNNQIPRGTFVARSKNTEIKCFNCSGIGHTAKVCPSEKRKKNDGERGHASKSYPREEGNEQGLAPKHQESLAEEI
jgi:hypothetical protein